jgi:hypothetical protein
MGTIHHIGKGFSLVPIDILNNSNNYSYLYKESHLVDTRIFRLGGMSMGFKDKPYCNLIYYGQSTSKLKDAKKIKSFGEHCIIDTNGKIVFKQDNVLQFPIYLQGVIVNVKDKYYNLLTGKIIVEGSKSISSTEFLFVEHKYNFDYMHQSPIGVYKIDWNTGEYEYFK